MEAARITIAVLTGAALLIFGGAAWECAGEAKGDKAKNWYRLFGLGCTVIGALAWVLI
jgi:hypothetical protein